MIESYQKLLEKPVDEYTLSDLLQLNELDILQVRTDATEEDYNMTFFMLVGCPTDDTLVVVDAVFGQYRQVGEALFDNQFKILRALNKMATIAKQTKGYNPDEKMTLRYLLTILGGE